MAGGFEETLGDPGVEAEHLLGWSGPAITENGTEA
jgi:hypothetical protein